MRRHEHNPLKLEKIEARVRNGRAKDAVMRPTSDKRFPVGLGGDFDESAMWSEQRQRPVSVMNDTKSRSLPKRVRTFRERDQHALKVLAPGAILWWVFDHFKEGGLGMPRWGREELWRTRAKEVGNRKVSRKPQVRRNRI